MNSEILEYAKELKKRSESLIKSELKNDEFTYRYSDWGKLIQPKMLIQLCNEIERINNLKPVGYMESNGIDYINKHGFTEVNAEQLGSRNTPLYKLD